LVHIDEAIATAARAGRPAPSRPPRATWELIAGTATRPKKDGKILKTEAEALPHLTESAQRLLADKLTTLGV
jgi:hypothetical protein